MCFWFDFGVFLDQDWEIRRCGGCFLQNNLFLFLVIFIDLCIQSLFWSFMVGCFHSISTSIFEHWMSISGFRMHTWDALVLRMPLWGGIKNYIWKEMWAVEVPWSIWRPLRKQGTLGSKSTNTSVNYNNELTILKMSQTKRKLQMFNVQCEFLTILFSGRTCSILFNTVKILMG